MIKDNSKKRGVYFGQALLEYALILVLGVLVSLVGAHAMGLSVSDLSDKLGGIFNKSASILVSDNFDDLDSWKKIYGPNCWGTSNGSLQTTKASCLSVLLNTTELPDDYKVTMDMAQLISGDGYGLMFRLSESQSRFTGYSFQVDHGYGNKFVFRRFDKSGELGKPLAVGTPPAGFDMNGEHKVEVAVNGDTFTAYIDGVEVLTASDSTYTSGSTGVRTWSTSQSNFSGFSVSTP